MENQILDDNAFQNSGKQEETMRNNIDRADYTIYAHSAVFVLISLVLLTNLSFLLGLVQNVDTILLMEGILSILVGVATITGFILFLMWFRRAYKNIQIIGYKTKHIDGWAVGGFFVPILAVFYPYNIMTEIWQKMQLTAEGNGIKHYLKGGIHGWWWFFWILSYIISYISLKMQMNGQVDIESQIPTWISVFTNVIELLDALFTILVVKSLRDTEKELRKDGGF